MLNHIDIVGRMTSDPKVGKTAAGKPCCNFTIACQNDFDKKADFVDCIAWSSAATFVSNHFSKGAMVCVSGRLHNRSWKDSSGVSRTKQEIVVERIYFYGSSRAPEQEFPEPDFVSADEAVPF